MRNFGYFERTSFQRLAKIPGWVVVVVGDDEASKNWSVTGVHYLIMDDQAWLGTF